MDAHSQVNGEPRFDFTNTSTMLQDSNGVPYWGDRNPNRYSDLYIPAYADHKILDYSRITDISYYIEPSIGLKDSARNLTQFCDLFHPIGTYQPYYCRNPSQFGYDALRVSSQYYTSIEASIISFWDHHNESVAYYISDVFGNLGYYPPLNPDIGYAVGGEFIFPSLYYSAPKLNPTHKPLYSPPYLDLAGQGFIITAFAPIFLGPNDDWWFGSACVDLYMSVNIKLIEQLKPTAGTLSVLTDDTGIVILATEASYNLLFNLTPATNISDQKVISNIKESNIFNFSRFFDMTGNSSFPAYGETNVTLVHTWNFTSGKYVLAYSRLTALKNWRLLVFAPHEEVFPEIVHISLSSEVSLAILIMSFVCLSVPFFFALVILFKWNSSPISSISPPFTLVSVSGAIMLNLSPAFLTLQMSDCQAWSWLLLLGFVMFFGGFLVKTYRIERIFTLGSKKFKKAKRLRNRHLFPGLLALILVEVVILIVWSTISPLSSVEVVDDTRTNTVINMCGSGGSTASFWGIFGAQAIYVIVVMACACYYSFMTRDIYMKEFREAKQILFSVYNFTAVSIIIIIVVSFVTSNPSATVLIIGIGTLFSTTTSCLVWLGPRIKRALNNQASDSTSGESNKETSSQETKKSSKGKSHNEDDDTTTNQGDEDENDEVEQVDGTVTVGPDASSRGDSPGELENGPSYTVSDNSPE
eukprot:TRINITY_DN2637_c0_g1_i2.p1 TRINITY_DN2637_c0_g1~~TRINITY_DN2637_c0_g1_i2.p1  ORF type:complete len:697 (+),score=55.97 TRINITY_DN2637_c0_g1_i2:255-2345(+)